MNIVVLYTNCYAMYLYNSCLSKIKNLIFFNLNNNISYYWNRKMHNFPKSSYLIFKKAITILPKKLMNSVKDNFLNNFSKEILIRNKTKSVLKHIPHDHFKNVHDTELL